MGNPNTHSNSADKNHSGKGSKVVALGLAGVMLTTALSNTGCKDNADRYGLTGSEKEHYVSNLEVKQAQLERILQDIMKENPDLLTQVSSVPLVLNHKKSLNERDILVVVIKGPEHGTKTVCAFFADNNEIIRSYSFTTSGQVLGTNTVDGGSYPFADKQEEMTAYDLVTDALRLALTKQL